MNTPFDNTVMAAPSRRKKISGLKKKERTAAVDRPAGFVEGGGEGPGPKLSDVPAGVREEREGKKRNQC